MSPQQPRSRPGRVARGAALTGGLLALLPLTVACGGEEDTGRPATSTTAAVDARRAGVQAPAKVEVIASLTGCKAKIRIEADELRQGVCHTEAGDYLITTFPEERFEQTWLDTARIYQGSYLVGFRWVISAQPKLLERFRPQVGGTVVHMSGTGPSAAPSVSP
jgi:hypothetical protein